MCIIRNFNKATTTEIYRSLWSEMGWKKKRDFINVPIYSYKNLGSVEHIMVCKTRQLSTDTNTIEFTTEELSWSTLYEKRCIVDGTG